MRFNSLAFRLFVSAAVWALIVIPAAAILFISLYRQAVERNFDARLGVYLTNLVASSTRSGQSSPATPRYLGEPLFELPFSGWYWQIATMPPNAQTIFASDSLLDDRVALPSSGNVPPDENLYRRATLDGPNGQRLRVVEREITLGQPSREQRYSYLVAGDAGEIDLDVGDFTRLVIGALSVLGFGLVLATVFQVHFGLRPLRAIGQGLSRIRSGEAERLEGRLPEEIQPLQRELNALLTSNRDIIDRARTHVGNLAHALKTPLSVITNEARSGSEPLARKVVEQAELMRGQITHHLDRARMAARLGVIGNMTDVGPAVEGLTRTLARIYDDRPIELKADLAPGLKFQGEKQDFEEMVGNLLDNACKWARSEVLVRASSNGTGDAAALTVTVDDDGPGLSPEERRNVIRRGARLDESMPGSGLGLSIAAELAHLYRGRLSLETSPKGGLRALLELPKA